VNGRADTHEQVDVMLRECGELSYADGVRRAVQVRDRRCRNDPWHLETDDDDGA
jgi:hypothetical protein